MNKDKAYLQHILDAIQKIISYTAVGDVKGFYFLVNR